MAEPHTGAVSKKWIHIFKICIGFQLFFAKNTFWNFCCSFSFFLIQTILDGSKQIAREVEDNHASVLVHCSDGWDRTAQVIKTKCTAEVNVQLISPCNFF